ncbi:hypothetical protein [Streptomyces omiyaensis]|uniref:Uncharacterized protein n=1 Tax=Streptomyces omiyaensis TaxID=68247 RepID=A0ABW7C1S0_9ACTN|nr:hypothetical protein [Streptomyces omiyaensis]GGY76912.1 hypothetical protein GCM10010363_67400 [Streptomyces omiyaensis]
MTGGLVREVELVLADGGFGPGSGLVVQDREDGVLVTWSADALIRPTILAHASDPAVRARVTLTGIRSALDHALAALFLDAGLVTTVPADGAVLVTRPALL